MVRKSPNHQPVNKDGLVGWWAYRNTGSISASGTWKDYSGGGNDGTLYDNTYINGNGGNFDGSGDYVLANSSVTGDTSVTTTFWFKSSKSSGEQKFIQINTDSTNDRGWGVGTLNGSFRIIIPGVAWGSVGTSVTDGNWHFAVVTRNGNTYNGYLDGGLSPNTNYTTSSGTFNDKIRIGGHPTGTSWVNGNIDDVMIFDRILNSNEMKKLYLKNKRG